MAPAVSRPVAYAWRDNAIWFYTKSANLAPAGSEEMELALVRGKIVLRHDHGNATQIIWGAKEVLPA